MPNRLEGAIPRSIGNAKFNKFLLLTKVFAKIYRKEDVGSV